MRLLAVITSFLCIWFIAMNVLLFNRELISDWRSKFETGEYFQQTNINVGGAGDADSRRFKS